MNHEGNRKKFWLMSACMDMSRYCLEIHHALFSQSMPHMFENIVAQREIVAKRKIAHGEHVLLLPQHV